MQSGQRAGITIWPEGKDVREKGSGRESQHPPDAPHDGQSALPGEVGRELRKHEQAGITGVERLITATELTTEKRRRLDRHGRCDGKAQDHEYFSARRLLRLTGRPGSNDQLLP